MEIDSIILIGVICIVIGFLIGQLVSSFGKGEKSEPADDEENSCSKYGGDLKNDNIKVALEGKEHEKSFSLDRKQRAKLHEIIIELNNWLETGPSLALKAEPQPPPLEDILPDLELPEESKSRPRFNPARMLVNALQSDVQKSKLPTESFVDQIDEVLQDLLKEAVNVKEPVRLMEWPGKGMVFMVGLDKYESVDEIPDEEIQNIIRAAVKGWEEHQVEETI